MSKKESPAIQLLRHVWEHEGEAMGERSWSRLNDAMGQALMLAVRCGMTFELDDFKTISADFNFGYWGGNDGHMLGERFYTAACAVDRDHGMNLSAARAFENWQERKPFILKDREVPSGRRLAVNSRFYWNGGHCVTLTSFSKEGDYITACSYKDRVEGEYRNKIDKRFKITIEDLREAGKPFAKSKKSETEAEVAA